MIANVLQVIGIVLIGVAGLLVSTALGLALFGIGALSFGLALER